MGLFGIGGLKHEHKIYKDDFTSKEDFAVFLKKKEEKVENIKELVKQVRDRHWDYFHNHDLEDNVFEKFEEIIDNLDKTQIDIQESIGSLKE